MGDRVTNVKLGAQVSGYVKSVFDAGKATDDLRTKAERFSRGKYDAKLGLQTAGARTELSALERQLQEFGRGTTEKRVNLNTLEAEARALALQARLEEMATKVTDARVDVDDAKAEAKISGIEASLLALGKLSADPNIDLHGVAQAEAEIAVLEARLRDLNNGKVSAASSSGGAGALATTLMALGPAVVPLAAAAVPAVAALGSSLAAAAVAAGTAKLAFSGVGTALSAVDKYQLQPTTANFQAMQAAMADLGPAGQNFVGFLGEISDRLDGLKNIAQAGMFPGIEAGIRSLLGLLPRVRTLLSTVSMALGQAAAQTGAALDTPYWKNFLTWLSREVPVVVAAASHAFLNLAQGITGVGRALAPLGNEFLTALGGVAREFAQWGTSLSTSGGFAAFVSYIRQEGPQVAHLLGALGSALVGIVRDAAPLGSVTIPLLTDLARVLADIANSPFGPVLVSGALALMSLSRAVALWDVVKGASLVTTFTALRAEGAGVGASLRGAASGLNMLAVKAGAAVLAITAIHDAFHNTGDEMQRVFSMAQAQSGGSLNRQIGILQQQLKIQQSIVNAAAWHVGMGPVNLFSNEGAAQAADKVKALTQQIDNLKSQRLADVAAAHAQAAANETLSGSIDSLTRAQEALTQANLDASNKMIAYKQAAADAAKAAASNAHTLNLNAQAGRDNMTALDNLAAAWNALPAKAQNATGAFAQARQSLIRTAEQMGATRKEAERLASQLLNTPKNVNTKAVLDDQAAIADIAAYKRWLQSIDGKTATSYVRTIHEQEYVLHNKATVPTGSADGSSVPKDGGPYSDRFLYMLAPGEEIITNRHGEADRFRAMRAAGMIPGLASGGTAGPSYNASQQLALLQAEQQIRQLLRQLAATGKNEVKGLTRRIDEVQLRVDRQQLRQAQIQPLMDKLTALRGIGGLDVSGALGLQPHNPIAAGVRGQIAAFRQQVLQAGGEWTKAMKHASERMIEHARRIDADNRAIDKATRRHDALTSKLGDVTSQMSQLQSTMDAYGQQVAGNFLTNPFGLGGQTTTFTPTVQNSPALSAATDQLNAAKAHLSSLQSGGGDILTRLANAAEASRVEQTVQSLQANVDSLSQPITTTTDALGAFKDTLAEDTKRAQEMADALKTLTGEGLTGGLFQQLAASGDVGFAQELAAAGQSAVDNINTLWNARAAAAAQVAAYATQTVYGQQQAILQGQIQQQNRMIDQVVRHLNHLNQMEANLPQRIENGVRQAVGALENQMHQIEQTVAAIPRQTQTVKRKRGR